MRTFFAVLRAMFATRTASEWLSVFGQTGVNVTPVAQMEDIPTDGQLLASGALVIPSDPSVEMPLILNHPLHIDGLQFVGPRRAPSLGEHTAEILAELGMSTDSIADFQSRGIV
jgi:formyl-CoA transferase